MEIDGWYRSTLDRGCQHSVDRVSAECRQPIDRLAGDYRPTCVLVDTQLTIACCWSSVDHVSVDRAATDMSIAGRSLLSIDTRSWVSLVHMIQLIFKEAADG